MIAESRTITRGTLWLIVTVLVALLLGTISITMSTVRSWAATIEVRGISNEMRIGKLETQFLVIETELRYGREKQEEMLRLLREHMQK